MIEMSNNAIPIIKLYTSNVKRNDICKELLKSPEMKAVTVFFIVALKIITTALRFNHFTTLDENGDDSDCITAKSLKKKNLKRPKRKMLPPTKKTVRTNNIYRFNGENKSEKRIDNKC